MAFASLLRAMRFVMFLKKWRFARDSRANGTERQRNLRLIMKRNSHPATTFRELYSPFFRPLLVESLSTGLMARRLRGTVVLPFGLTVILHMVVSITNLTGSLLSNKYEKIYLAHSDYG